MEWWEKWWEERVRRPDLEHSQRSSPTSTLRPVPEQGAVDRVRLAELLAALSLGIDLGVGQPMEHVLRQSEPATIGRNPV